MGLHGIGAARARKSRGSLSEVPRDEARPGDARRLPRGGGVGGGEQMGEQLDGLCKGWTEKAGLFRRKEALPA